MAQKGTSRYYSSKQEHAIADLLGAKVVPNSGACRFAVSDVIADNWIFEAKTCMSPKQSFSLKKDWFDKNERERMDAQLPYSAVVFQFEPNGENYFVVNERTFKILYEMLKNNN
jgi:hypothetical protein